MFHNTDRLCFTNMLREFLELANLQSITGKNVPHRRGDYPYQQHKKTMSEEKNL